ncbi:MAG: MarR family transcriptional regulator [Olsenella sp.]|jgi:DNA-binding MarR family transcriptional regulator
MGEARKEGAAAPADWDGLAHDLIEVARGIRGSGQHCKGADRKRGENNVLHLLHHSPEGMAPAAIAEACHITSARVAQTLNQLEGHGLVRRRPSERDRRGVVVTITEAGERELEARFAKRTRLVASVLERLGEDDARELVRICGRVGAIVDEMAWGGERR